MFDCFKCEKCGKSLSGLVTYLVYNNYPVRGFPHDTKKIVCEKCEEKFHRYITKKYDEFFEKDEKRRSERK